MCLLVLCSGGNVSTHFSVEGVSREGWLLGIKFSSKCRRKRKNSYDDVHRYRSDFNKNLISTASVKAIGDVFIHPFYSFYLFTTLPRVAHMHLLLQLPCDGLEYGHVPGIPQE